MNKPYTLVMISKDNKLLLGMKKHGFGEGWWNGFGGKVNSGETIEEAAIREVQEEAGFKASNLKDRGVLSFHFEGEEEVHEVHIFECADYDGEPTETEEMLPAWFDLKHVPYENMWPADRIWMPVFLEGKKLSGDFYFTKDKKVASYTLNEIN